ncbi:M20/M25/M40 family metallo-hydrolase [Nocardia sp. NPDC049149]|uniref:M20/M25/M40 family metallo-hydrolase n=1 Tax=Nocardia sp. NPDC049149 TaxID=3364315 RepID=UPI00371F3A7A
MRKISGLLAFLVLLTVVVVTAWDRQPHGYRTESAPATEFSAGRAMRTVTAIAQRPHPIGTAEHDRVRDYLVEQLRTLGLDTEVQTGVGRAPAAIERDVLSMGRVANIVARLPGTQSKGTVFLTAHYDSVPSGPGANDDGVGVAAVLETVRALRASAQPLRNDVVVLLTDGEEAGLLGAEAFVTAGKDGRDTGVVINHEARGAGGPLLLWRTSRPDGALIRTVADAAPRPNTDSVATMVASARTSSSTDYSAFDPSGLRVLDWAYVGRSAYYHNRLDDPAHVDLPTVQELGDNSLGLAEAFGGQDLTAEDAVDRTYFQLPFGILVVLPVWVIIALAVATVLAVTWIIRHLIRAGDTSLARVLGAAATVLVAAPIAAGAAYGLWEVIKLIRPDYRPLVVDPYRPEFYYLAILVLSTSVLAAWYLLARRLFDTAAAAAGMLGTSTVIGAVCAALLPTTAHLLIVPACAAALGVAATFVLPERWRLPVLTVFLTPAAVFLGTATWPLLQTGITTAPFLVAPAVLLFGGLLALTLTRAWPTHRAWTIPAAAFVLAIALATVGLAVDRSDDNHPLGSQLVYALDADHNAAQWLSRDAPNRWTHTLVDKTTPTTPFAQLWSNAVSSGPAATQPLSPPTAEILSDTTESNQRTVHLRLRSTRDATSIALRYDTAPSSLTVAGRDLTPVPAKGILFNAPPSEGIEVQVTSPAGPLHLVDYTWLSDAGLALSPPPDVFLRQDSTAAVFRTIPGL